MIESLVVLTIGTLYALLMSTLNVGGVVSDNLGGLLTWAIGVTATDFSRLWILVLVHTVTLIVRAICRGSTTMMNAVLFVPGYSFAACTA